MRLMRYVPAADDGRPVAQQLINVLHGGVGRLAGTSDPSLVVTMPEPCAEAERKPGDSPVLLEHRCASSCTDVAGVIRAIELENHAVSQPRRRIG